MQSAVVVDRPPANNDVDGGMTGEGRRTGRRRLAKLRAAVRDLLEHDSFPRAGHALRDHPELLSEDADYLFDELAAEVEQGDGRYPMAAVVQLRGFMRRCRSADLDAVFPPDHSEIDPQVVAIIRPDMRVAEDAEAAFERDGDASVLVGCAAAWRRIARDPSLDSAYPGLKAALLNDAGGALLRTYWARGEMNGHSGRCAATGPAPSAGKARSPPAAVGPSGCGARAHDGLARTDPTGTD
jgi:hypothetical protein